MNEDNGAVAEAVETAVDKRKRKRSWSNLAPEIRAMAEIDMLLDELSKEEARRVMAWANAKYAPSFTVTMVDSRD